VRSTLIFCAALLMLMHVSSSHASRSEYRNPITSLETIQRAKYGCFKNDPSGGYTCRDLKYTPPADLENPGEIQWGEDAACVIEQKQTPTIRCWGSADSFQAGNRISVFGS